MCQTELLTAQQQSKIWFMFYILDIFNCYEQHFKKRRLLDYGFKQATMGNYLMFLVIPKQCHVKTKKLYLIFGLQNWIIPDFIVWSINHPLYYNPLASSMLYFLLPHSFIHYDHWVADNFDFLSLQMNIIGFFTRLVQKGGVAPTCE